MERVLLQSAHFRLTRGDPEAVVRLVRTAEPFVSLDEMRQSTRRVEEAVAVLPKGLRLVVDAREAPARNDAEFEEQFAQARRPILAHFVRIAVLVKSATGRLQVARYGREDGLPHQLVFDSEDIALAYLTSTGPLSVFERQ